MTALAPQQPQDPVISYTPLAEHDEIKLTANIVKSTLAVRSKSGQMPGQSEIIKFMMLCRSRRLNPFVGDAYLIGYDSKDGTQWSLISSIQSLRKRAEGHPQFDGCRRGVILKVPDGDGHRIEEREGAWYTDGEILLGGWAECYRKDNAITYRETVKLAVYDSGRSRWAADPGGMITKVAEAAALRRAFPSDLAGLYIRDEFDRDATPTVEADRRAQRPIQSLDQLADQLETNRAGSLPAAASEPESVKSNTAKVAKWCSELQRCQHESDVDAVMVLVKTDKSLNDYDRASIEETAVEIRTLIEQDRESENANV